ncbi:protein-export chaperone SecB [Meridianimarinicoccus roseus]|uniref:Protein-export protein SecB n=1 Tax=Meridianimarinicoccus roseus TaxID=2072018 RepID=A0A2V2LCN3_9RHOB|nr:protein-export chaperone SecB [Meridianimarinicoccus roseus]PWR02892.1 protein-export chaperone SecB [Meridianimarinicoccus roseus]
MADTPNGATPQQPAQVKMQVLAQYIRDLSFENIVAQKGTGGDVKPDVQVQVGLDAKKRTAENQYEVLSKYNITSKNKETGDVLFAMEVEYGGVFLIEGVPEQQLHPFLMIECPRMLFPFVRRIVSDMTRDGGFPALNLDTVDFMTIYRNEIERRQRESSAAQPTNA